MKTSIRHSAAFFGSLLALSILFVNAGLESALAGSTTAMLGVSATVSKSCRIATTPLAFAPYDPITTHSNSNLQGTGAISVTCTKGATASIGLGEGSNSPGAATTRAMSNGLVKLSYEIYKDSAQTQRWGNSAADLLDAGTAPSKTPRNFFVYGVIPAGQDVPTGNYTDTIVVTVNF